MVQRKIALREVDAIVECVKCGENGSKGFLLHQGSKVVCGSCGYKEDIWDQTYDDLWEEFTSWSCDDPSMELWPHSSAGNEVTVRRHKKSGEFRFDILCDLSDEEDVYPALTYEQLRGLRWALDMALREANKILREEWEI